MSLEEGEYKIITQPEKSIIVNKTDKEAELAKLIENLNNLEVTNEEKEEWANQELERRQKVYIKRIEETNIILDKLNL